MMPQSNRITAAALLTVVAIFVFAATPVRAAMPSDSVPTLAPLIKKVSPAVVNIATSGTVEIDRSPFFNDPFFRRFFGDRPQQPQQRQTQSVGSGVIINAAKGYVLTNSHVVAKADEIIITLTDRRQLKAELVGHDPGTDVAVLKVNPDSLTALKMADSDHLEGGDFVGGDFGDIVPGGLEEVASAGCHLSVS